MSNKSIWSPELSLNLKTFVIFPLNSCLLPVDTLEGDALLLERNVMWRLLRMQLYHHHKPSALQHLPNLIAQSQSDSRVSAIDDESCVSMGLGAVLAATYSQCFYDGENRYHLLFDHIELIRSSFQSGG